MHIIVSFDTNDFVKSYNVARVYYLFYRFWFEDCLYEDIFSTEVF